MLHLRKETLVKIDSSKIVGGIKIPKVREAGSLWMLCPPKNK
jgi:hypothetical protein